MVSKKEIINAFKIKGSTNSNFLGEIGYDNPRESIDPHIKTKVISSKEAEIKNLNGIRNAAHFSSIQAAINEVSGGGVVYIPTGVYEINQPLELGSSRITILGDGLTNSVISGAVNGYMIQGMANDNRKFEIVLRDLQFRNSDVSGGGIDFRNITSGRIENVRVRVSGTGINLDNFCFYNIIENCEVTNAQTGFFLSGANENQIRGSRTNICENAMIVSGANNVYVDGFAVELSTNGIIVGGADCTIIKPRFEQVTNSIFNRTGGTHMTVLGARLSTAGAITDNLGDAIIMDNGNIYALNLSGSSLLSSGVISGSDFYSNGLISGGNVYSRGGFTGSGAYTNFTISGGIVITAS